MKVAGLLKSSLQMRKLKAPEGGNLPRVLHTVRAAAGKGPWSPDTQCRDLILHTWLIYAADTWLSTCCVPGTVLASGITVANVELIFFLGHDGEGETHSPNKSSTATVFSLYFFPSTYIY